MTTYDEDLRDNPFHCELLRSHIDLVEKASQEGWIVCVPRRASVSEPITFTDICEHILIPDENSGRSHTLNKTEITFSNDCIQVHAPNTSLNGVRVLFKETFYLRQLKYTVYCLESPINQNVDADFAIAHVTTLKDCIDFLRIETDNSDILINIGDACEEFLLLHEDIHGYSLQELKDTCNVLFTKCLLGALKYNGLQKRTGTDDGLLGNLKVAVETYSQHCLNNQVFNAICSNTLHADACINKNTRNLQYIQLNQLVDIVKFQDSIPSAKYELGKLNKSMTTSGKLLCLTKVFQALSDNGKENLTTEDFMQLLAFLIVNVNVNNWVGNFVYLQQFNFSSTSSLNESAFLLTTFEAALEYVKSDALFKIDVVTDSSQSDILKVISSADLEQIEALFKDKPEVCKKLCHPLCTCDNCKQSMSSVEYTANWCDDKGRNGLHFACLYGFPYVVDFFIHRGVNVCGVDYLGSAAIHYASSRGHQNALLLLLHSGADLNVLDGDGNAPIHLASNNGHESCVKALLYYSEHASKSLDVDLQNSQGNTALHLAVNWGYLNIISTLLQYNASPDVRNKKNHRVIDICYNYYIKKLILNKAKGLGDSGLKNKLRCFGIRPKNFEQYKKVELLLKAVENNDLPLSCFYLGIPVPSFTSEEKTTCHPLCSCERCSGCSDSAEDELYIRPKQSLNINTCNSDGLTALHVAAKFGRDEILRLLLDAGANVNTQTYRLLHTPLHLACINQRLHAVKELMQCGACNVDAQDAKGCTAIHHACLKNYVRILDALLGGGCDLGVKNNEGKTALQQAQDMSLNNVVKLIKEKSCVAVLSDDGFMS